MTVPNTIRLVEYDGDDVQTEFSFPFRIFEASHLIVTIISAAGVETIQTESLHYTIDGVGVPSGGTVTMGAAPATGETIRLERYVPHTQIFDLRNQGTYMPQSVEDAMDRIVMMIQYVGDIFVFPWDIPEYTRATRPNVSVQAIGEAWYKRLIILNEDDGSQKLQRCLKNVTPDTYGWQTENTGGWL